jgi:PadR family transcriptional regulator PadR
MDATLSGHLQELRRGTVVVASLTVLREPGYGYSLLETLSEAGFEVEANTLYPLLRRLEAQGLLTSEWNTAEARPRKFYRTTEQGESIAGALRGEWVHLNRAIADLDQTEDQAGNQADDQAQDRAEDQSADLDTTTGSMK